MGLCQATDPVTGAVCLTQMYEGKGLHQSDEVKGDKAAILGVADSVRVGPQCRNMAVAVKGM